MNIGVISEYDVFDYNSQSGVIYHITKELKKEHDVVWISAKLNGFLRWIMIVYKALNRLLRVTGCFTTHLHTPFYSRLIGYCLAKQMKNEKFELLFAFGSYNIAYLKTNVPIVYRTDAVYYQMVDYYWKRVPKYFQKKGDIIEQKALDKSSLIVLPSDWAKEAAVTHYNICEDKLCVIETGAEVYSVNKKYLMEPNKQTIKMVFIGKDIYRKGIEIALDVNKILKNKFGVDSSLVVIGGMIDKPDYRDKSVNWIGFLNKNIKDDKERFENLISSSDLLILPTRAECAGIAFAEASAYGLPIFTYDTGGIGNYVINGVNGYRLNLNSTAENFANRIYQSWMCCEFVTLSNGGKKLYKDKFNWDCWRKRLYERMEEII